MFQTGCMALKKWLSEGWNLSLNLNVSYAQLSDWNYIQEIIMIVKSSQVLPGKDCNRSGGQLFYQRYEDL